MNSKGFWNRTTVARATLALAMVCCATQAQPIITAFAPTVGTPGDIITLYGSGFSLPNLAVAFWQGNYVTAGGITSDSQMTVVVPNGITTGPISVQQIGGNPNYTAANFTAIGSGPYISGFAPAYGKTNDLLVINGVHFTGVKPAGVKFNGTNSVDATANADGTQINVHVPYGATSGFITVATPLGTSNSPSPFTVLGPGPFVAGFSPQVGTPGTTVSVTGVQFSGVTNVTFNGKSGVNLAVQSDTLLRVDAPSGVSSGPLTVRSALGTFTSFSNFFVPPTITAFSPTNGRAGTNITLTGSSFVGVTNVTVGGRSTTDFLVVNNTNLVVPVPTGAATGLLRVTAPAGSAFSASNFVVQPLISGFSPASGPVGTSVVLSGANFNVGTPVVKFNGVTATTTTGVSFGQLTAVVPVGATPGPISISTADGSFTTPTLFYLPAAITSFTPTNSPPGSRVTILGHNFTGTTAVSFNGSPATDFVVTNNTSLGVTVPAGVTTGPLSVTTPAGSVTASGLFYAAPAITSFSPTHGLPGTNVMIAGSSFTGATSVQFGGFNGNFLILDNSQILAIVPNGASNGPITVITPGGTNTSSTSFSLDYFADLSVSLTADPNPVTVTSNVVYTITVVNNGPLAAQNLRLTNMLPNTATLHSVVLPDQWVGATNGNPLEFGVLNFPANSTATLLVTAAPRTPGIITASAMIGSDYPDPYSTNNTASVSTTVSPLPLLSIGLLGDRVQLSWSLALTNFVLESATSVSGSPAWSGVDSAPEITGSLKVVTVTNSGPTTFYRLRK